MPLPLNLRFDEYDFRAQYDSTDGSPTYMGFAPPGTDESATRWTIHAFAYDGNRQATSRKIYTKVAWSDRAALAV